MLLRRTQRNKTAADKAMQTYASKMLPGATLEHAEWPPEEDTEKPLAIGLKLDASRSIQAEEDHFRFPLPRWRISAPRRRSIAARRRSA